MKQKIPKPPFSSFLPLIFVAVFALFWHPTANQATPTKQQPTSTLKSIPVASDHKTVTTSVKTTPRTTSASPPIKPNKLVRNAPKQAEVAKSVTTQYVYRIFGTTNDPLASSDWTLTTDNAPTAWDTATGSSSQTIVAVIDTGFALNHEDLTNQWYQNPGETGMTQVGDSCWTGTPQNKATNGCDDDNNGYVDDWRGWNFVHSDNNPQTGRDNSTGNGVAHGTEVAGLVGAAGNNGLGSTAIDQNAKIMPLAALDDDGMGYTSDIAAAILYAVDNGANVINMSLGTYSIDSAVGAAVDYATAHNVALVAAAGNCGDGADVDCPSQLGAIGYPAAYPDVIAVGATTQAGARASFGSYGKELDISAPGYNLPVSTSWSQANPIARYVGGLYGTSFSSPQVASLIALIKSIRPSTSIADITAIIDGTASKPSGMNGLPYTEQFGHGIIDAAAALNVAEALNASSSAPTLLQSGGPKTEHILTANYTATSGCEATSGGACTVEFTNSDGYTRYLPYTVLSSSNTGWSWNTSMLETTNWEVRARDGENITDSPYVLIKKG
ncbi:MAG: S8 family serine peptidase [Candidatus Nomurabacteria bacterium]|nr:MAG: S8 family serine peptidase [Candidatus Nomurabacteria bacterium]